MTNHRSDETRPAVAPPPSDARKGHGRRVGYPGRRRHDDVQRDVAALTARLTRLVDWCENVAAALGFDTPRDIGIQQRTPSGDAVLVSDGPPLRKQGDGPYYEGRSLDISPSGDAAQDQGGEPAVPIAAVISALLGIEGTATAVAATDTDRLQRTDPGIVAGLAVTALRELQRRGVPAVPTGAEREVCEACGFAVDLLRLSREWCTDNDMVSLNGVESWVLARHRALAMPHTCAARNAARAAQEPTEGRTTT
jgi:hypothetical protein